MLKCRSGDWVHASVFARFVYVTQSWQNTFALAQTSISQLNSSLGSLDTFLLTGTLNVTSLAASVDSVAAAAVPPQPTTANTLSALASAEARPSQGTCYTCVLT